MVCAVASCRDGVDHSFLITGGPAELITGLVGASLNLFCTLYFNPEYYWGGKNPVQGGCSPSGPTGPSGSRQFPMLLLLLAVVGHPLW